MIYLTGDTHAEFNRFSRKTFDATENDYVIICGNFGGVWDESSYQKYWLDWLEAKPWTTLFVDGNHGNYDLLASYPVSQWQLVNQRFAGTIGLQIRNGVNLAVDQKVRYTEQKRLLGKGRGRAERAAA